MSCVHSSCVMSGIAAASLLLGGTGHVDAGDSWLSFQNGGHVSLTIESASDRYALSDDIAWTASLPGYGQSSPIVWNHQVYVTSVAGAQKETYFITAFDLESGSTLWSHEVPNATPQENSNYVSKAAPTPAADDDGLIAFLEGGNLIALTHGGEVRWQRNLAADYGDVGARHGLSASVEQDETAAYIWVERAEEPYVLSIDKQTGETNWKVGGIGATSWASPRLVPVEGGQHLVLSAIGSFVGLDPQTGDTLWRMDDVTGNSTPTPIPLGDGRFLIGATVGRGESGGGPAAESNGVVAIRKVDDQWQADYAWRATRATSSFGSPIAHNGTAYFVNRTGVLYGLDLATGEEQFAERLAGSIWATPLGVGERVLFFGKDGQVNVLAGTAAAHEITTWTGLPSDPQPVAEDADAPTTGSTLYAATLSGGRLLLRRGDRLFAVDMTQQRQ